MDQPISDVKQLEDEAGYPPQAPGYPTGLGPTQSFPQQGYHAQAAYPPEQGYPLQPYPQVSDLINYTRYANAK